MQNVEHDEPDMLPGLGPIIIPIALVAYFVCWIVVTLVLAMR